MNINIDLLEIMTEGKHLRKEAISRGYTNKITRTFIDAFYTDFINSKKLNKIKSNMTAKNFCLLYTSLIYGDDLTMLIELFPKSLNKLPRIIINNENEKKCIEINLLNELNKLQNISDEIDENLMYDKTYHVKKLTRITIVREQETELRRKMAFINKFDNILIRIHNIYLDDILRSYIETKKLILTHDDNMKYFFRMAQPFSRLDQELILNNFKYENLCKITKKIF